MKILITAFEPFNNNQQNYSKEVLKQINNHNNLIKEVLPVTYYGSFEAIKGLILKNQLTTIILMGEARTYKSVGFEVIGINKLDNRADNSGFIPTSTKIIDNNIDGLFSTLDYDLFEESFKEVNVKYFKSLSAGLYVCNSLLYQTLLYIKENNLNIKCGFIHIPDLKTQNIKEIVNGINQYILKIINI